MFRLINILFISIIILTTSGCSLHAKMFSAMARDKPIKQIAIYEDNNGSYEKWVKGGTSLTHLCGVFYDVRQYDRALDCLKYYEKNNFLSKDLMLVPPAPTSYERSFEKESVIVYYHLMSSIHIDIENYDMAYKFATKAINFAQCSNETREKTPYQLCSFVHEVAPAYANKVIAATKLNKHAEAIKLADTIPKLYWVNSLGGKMQGRSHIIDMIHAAEARAYMSLGMYKKAEESINKSNFTGGELFVRILMGAMSGGISELGSSAISDPFQMDQIYMHAKICLELGKIECALKGYTALLNGSRGWWRDKFNFSNVTERPGLYALVLKDRGYIELKQGRPIEALKYFKKSIDLIESQRASFKTEASKIGFAGDKFTVYRDTVDLLIKLQRYDEALAYVERGKARALVDMLANKKQFGDKIQSQQVASLVTNLSHAESGKFNKPTDTSAQGLKKQRSVNRALLRKRRNDINTSQPELASLVTVSAPSISNLQKLLPVGETLVEYYGDNKQLYAFVMSRTGVGAVKLNAKAINQTIHNFRNALMKPKSTTYKRIGLKLYSQLISPLVNNIKTKNVTFVPHGALHYLPFGALPTKTAHLIDYYNIRVLPSASVMNFLNKKSKAKGTLLALGNPDLDNKKLDLPGAQKEAIAITRKQKGARLLLREKATETAVKQYGGNYKYLHFASHGVFDPDKPLQSGLLLSKDAANDGNLTVGELYNLSLNADLVTLSACETALGKVANGDDVVGFTRGFLYAGAKSIVSSLWKVDDNATNKLMQSFYANLKRTDKRSALRTAQLEVKEQYRHPYYWAAFQLTGAIN